MVFLFEVNPRDFYDDARRASCYAGIKIGALILVIVGAALFGVNLPLIDSPRAALIALVVLAVVKVALTQVHRAMA